MKKRKYLKTSEVADILGCSISTVIRLISKGLVRGIKMCRDWRVDMDSFNDWLSRGGSAA